MVPQAPHRALRLPELRRDGNVFRRAGRRILGRPAADAIELTRLTPFPTALSPVVEKARELAAENERGAPFVYRLETGLDPGSHGVLVYAKQSRSLLHRIAAVELHAPRVEPLHDVNVPKTRFTSTPTLDPLIAPPPLVARERMPPARASVSCANLGR